MAGRYFDEWTVGDRIVHQPSRTVTETDNLMFSAMTHNMQPLHLDAEYAKASEFGQILVNATFTFSLAVGLSIADTTVGTLIANLGDRSYVVDAFELPADFAFTFAPTTYVRLGPPRSLGIELSARW